MATITIDGQTVSCPDGARLLDVCRDAGAYISSLCYIEGIPPYAGCRMCLVEVEGGRGLQLSCTSTVTDGMIVRTKTEEVAEARKAVLSIILANHSDRCLTCHRREHCHPGDICLRDDIVTHRCVTCPKNYRCELQATCEMVGMSQYEPWEGEARSFYATPEYPPADRANPFLEFDPKMCIICTRCVRACDELRHTGAITLAGRGFSTRIAFGAGVRIDESNCDFCGACIDVCPTATLLEHPHKWVSRPDQWVETVCSYCSVGCTIKLGVKDGRGVMVRPSTINPVSHDQICVRGRYHYDALRSRDYLARPLIRRGDLLAPVSWDEALDTVAERLDAIVREHGPESVGVLVSPLTVNEEAYTAQKLARAVLGTNNLDFSAGAVARAVGSAVRGAFGTEVLPADMTALKTATHVVIVGDDLEASHPVAALRLKDAAVYNRAKVVVVGARWGEMVDFSASWLRPAPGQDASVLAALAQGVLASEGQRAKLSAAGVGGLGQFADGAAPAPAIEGFEDALAVLRDAAASENANTAIVVAPTHVNAWLNGALARAAANLAIVVCGPERAPASLYVLPTDVNVTGLRDLGVTPDMLPAYHSLLDNDYRAGLEARWGGRLPTGMGKNVHQMIEAARSGQLKALLVVGDNPLLTAPDKACVRAALEALELLVVIDGVMTDTAELAHVVLPDVDVYGKEGTYTPADRRVLRRSAATSPREQAQPALVTLADLGSRLAARRKLSVAFSPDAETVMAEIADLVPLYAGSRYDALLRHERQSMFDGAVPLPSTQQLVQIGDLTGGSANGSLSLLTGRSLYTSLEAAALHKPDADKLHREEVAEISFDDGARLGLSEEQPIVIVSNRGSLRLRAHLTDTVPAGAVYVPLLYDGGAVTALLEPESEGQGLAHVEVQQA